MFDAVWEKVVLPEDDTTYVMQPFIEDEFYGENAEMATAGGCYSYANVKDSTFYGESPFDYGALTCHNKRVWECLGDAETCTATTPGTADTKAIWGLTTFKFENVKIFTVDEMMDMVVPIMECRGFPQDTTVPFPFLAGDSVCDPEYPDFVAWTCLDPVECSKTKPDLDDSIAIADVW